MGRYEVYYIFFNFLLKLRFFSSSQTSENLQAAIVGSQLNINFSLVFTEFEPDTISFELQMKAENDLAIRVYVPPQNSLASVFGALKQSSRFNLLKTPSKIKLNVANDEVFNILLTIVKIVHFFL